MISKWPIRNMFRAIGCGIAATAILMSIVAYMLTKQWICAVICLLSAGIFSLWMALGLKILSDRLALFTDEICLLIDDMMEDKTMPDRLYDKDTLLDRILFRLSRLYHSLQNSKAQIAGQRADLQSLISDVSHQIKTPATNLKLAADALLEQDLSHTDQTSYLTIITSQVEKLNFLMNVLVKSSRLENGLITLVKKTTLLFETLAAALSGVLPAAQEKKIKVMVEGDEKLQLLHDSKWTEEALFNILDNAVKYTPCNGTVKVSVFLWESYTKIDIADTGRGIPEDKQGAVFGRFYREPEVHEIEGLGLGLYLAREIIAKQGGYIKVSSQSGQGSVFSVFLPNQG